MGWGSPEQRLLANIRREDCGYATACWIWQLSLTPDGYGRMQVDGQRTSVQRVAYEVWVGPIPEGFEIDHLCCVRACVNPDHLEPKTHEANCARNAYAQQTHCASGHAFDDANTYIRPDGRRDCRRCIVDRQRRYRERREAA